MRVHVVMEEDEAGHIVGWVPELPGCTAQARDTGTLRERIAVAARLYLDTCLRRPDVAFRGVEEMEVP